MTSSNVTRTITSTIIILEATTKDYNIVKDDKSLLDAFHEAGRGLLLVETALRTAKTQLGRSDLATNPQSAMRSLEACNQKAEFSQSIFKVVAQKSETPRLECYKAAVRQEGKGSMVEVLVVGMMKDVCNLIKQSAVEAAMEDRIEELRDAIDKLSMMEPSVGNEWGNTFSHFGSGHQFNATGGTQNNNTGSGNQFSGATFSGAVHFGNNP